MFRIILLSILLIVLSGCPFNVSDKDCEQRFYKFDIPIEIWPQKESYATGDTINVSCTIQNIIFDKEFNHPFLFDSIDFRVFSNILRIDTLDSIESFMYNPDQFEYIIDANHNFTIGNLNVYFDHNYENSYYTLNYKIVPKIKGVFYFRFQSTMNVSTSHHDQFIYSQDSNCSTKYWTLHFKTNDGLGNKDLLKSSSIENILNDEYQKWGNSREGPFCFTVE